MTASSNLKDDAFPFWMQGAVSLLGAYLLLTIVAYVVAGDTGVSALHALLFGWLLFLLQRMESFQPDWPTAGVGIVAFAILLVIVQSIGSKLTRSSTAPGRWAWRSTLAVTLGLVLLFAGGVAFIGAAHQAIWLTIDSRTWKDRVTKQWPARPGALNVIAQARFAAMQTQSRNNLKQIILGLHNSHDNSGTFPPGAVVDDQGHALRGWTIDYARMNYWVREESRTEPWDGPANQPLARGAITDLVNPQLGWHGQFDENGYAYMHYAANVHGFPNNRGLKIADITDGTANTLAVGEVAENFQPWTSPWNRRDPADGINDVPWGFGGPPSQRGAHFVFFDGRVRNLSRNIDRDLLRSLGLPNDGPPTKPIDVLLP